MEYLSHEWQRQRQYQETESATDYPPQGAVAFGQCGKDGVLPGAVNQDWPEVADDDGGKGEGARCFVTRDSNITIVSRQRYFGGLYQMLTLKLA